MNYKSFTPQQAVGNSLVKILYNIFLFKSKLTKVRNHTHKMRNEQL